MTNTNTNTVVPALGRLFAYNSNSGVKNPELCTIQLLCNISKTHNGYDLIETKLRYSNFESVEYSVFNYVSLKFQTIHVVFYFKRGCHCQC